MKTSRPAERERKMSDFDFNLDEIIEEAKWWKINERAHDKCAGDNNENDA